MYFRNVNTPQPTSLWSQAPLITFLQSYTDLSQLFPFESLITSERKQEKRNDRCDYNILAVSLDGKALITLLATGIDLKDLSYPVISRSNRTIQYLSHSQWPQIHIIQRLTKRWNIKLKEKKQHRYTYFICERRL